MAKRSPRTTGGKPRRVPVSTKITPDLRDRLDTAAQNAGRTLGNEIERRLEQSCRLKPEHMELLQDERTITALIAIAVSWENLATITGKQWYEDVNTLLAAQAAAHSIMGYFKGLDGSSISGSPDKISPEMSNNIVAVGSLLAELTRDMIKKQPEDRVLSALAALSQTVFGTAIASEKEASEKNNRQKAHST
jgi:hypothetical protein